MRRSIRRLVSLGVILSLLSQPYAFASDESNKENSNKQNIENKLEQFAAEEKPRLDTKINDWSTQQEALVPHLLSAAERLDAEAARLTATRGEDYLTDLINRNQFIVEDAELGIRMEYRLIDGHRVPRLLIDDHVYIIVDEALISRKSKHLNQYVSRTHHESGQNRVKFDKDDMPVKTMFGRDKTVSGRDLSILFLNEDVANLEVLPKPKATQWKWWREYFISKYKQPTLEDFSMALVTGAAMQGALTLGATYLKHHFMGTDFSMVPTYWTMAYGLTIGTFYSFYRNWTVSSGSKLTRILKSQAISTLYAVGLVMSVTDGSAADRISTLSIFTAEGQAKNASIIANGIMNNFAKDYWYEVSRTRESNRENSGPFSIKVPFTNKSLNWKKSSLESQMLYLIPWSINVVSLLTLASTDLFKIPGIDVTIPIFQFAGIPVAMYWSKWYARRLANRAKADPDMHVRARELEKIALEREASWDNSFGLNISQFPGRVSYWVRSAASSTKEVCRKLLGRD